MGTGSQKAYPWMYYLRSVSPGVGAPLGPHPVLAAHKSALIGLTDSHLGCLDSPVRGQLRWGGKETAGSRRGCGLQGPSRLGPWRWTCSLDSINTGGMGTSRRAPPPLNSLEAQPTPGCKAGAFLPQDVSTTQQSRALLAPMHFLFCYILSIVLT